MTLIFEILLTRLFSIVLFGPQADLAVSLGILGVGIGAVFAFYQKPLPAESPPKQWWIPVAMGLLMVAAVFIILQMPLTYQNGVPPESYQERANILYQVVNTPMVAVAVMILLIPFILGGYGIAVVLNSAGNMVGTIYGADLVAGAVGAAFGYGLLYVVAAPDMVFLCLALGAISSAFLIRNNSASKIAYWSLLSVGIAAFGIVITANPARNILKIKYASGYSEDTIVYSEWSPLSRVAINKSKTTGAELVVLDNASASLVVQNDEQLKTARRSAARSMVYRLVDSCRRAAIIGASAGPEVAVANYYDCKSVQAIDLVGKIFDVVAKRYPNNPYLYSRPNVSQTSLDGRTAIAISPVKFDVIQMVHANLWSASGIISNAWSHSYVETQEAFQIYLSKLRGNGILSFARGDETRRLLLVALSVLQKDHPTDYWRYALTVGGNSNVLLVRPRPWTADEVAKVQTLITNGDYGTANIDCNPLSPAPCVDPATLVSAFSDDRPYTNSKDIWISFLQWLDGKASFFDNLKENQSALTVVYSIMVVQFGIILILGALLVIVPAIFYRSALMAIPLRKTYPFLLYGFFIGYGFMALELVALNKCILYLGNPSMAAALVISTFMIGAGIGSMTLQKWTDDSYFILWPLLSIVILAPLTLMAIGYIQYALPIESLLIRCTIITAVILPLAFFMGFPFSLMMRYVNRYMVGLTPWMFAINTWSSVLAGFGTTLIARFYGFKIAGLCGAISYAVCLVILLRVKKQMTIKDCS